LHHKENKGFSKEIKGSFPRRLSGYKIYHQYSANESLEKIHYVIKSYDQGANIEIFL
jgi:hypothetical protein